MGVFTLEAPSESTSEFETIPEDSVLLAEIATCEVRPSMFWVDKDDPSKGKKDEVSFRFRVVEDGPFFGRSLWGSTSTNFVDHPNCRLRNWVQEILGEDDLPSGFTFDTDTLVGSQVKVVVGNYNKKDGTVGERVVDLLRQRTDVIDAPF